MIRFIYILPVLVLVNSNIVLESERVTNWGSWGSWDRCPKGTFATALQLKIERPIDGDDTAMNGIKLHCAKLDSPSIWVGSIQSKVGGWGDWTPVTHCNHGFMNGFQLRVERPQGRGDDTSANDLRGFCTGSLGQNIGGGGNGWGDWGQELRCYRNQAICAIKTQVEDHARDIDDTSLNNVQMECCDIPNPATSCAPRDKWEVVYRCDGRNRLNSYTCRYNYRTGTTNTRSTSTGGGNTQGNSWSTEFGVSAISNGLSANFQRSLTRSSTTNHNWASESSTTWNSEISTSADFDIMPGHTSILSQVVGYCGDYVVRTTSFRLQDYDINGTLVDILNYQNYQTS